MSMLIINVSAVTSVGLTAQQTCAAIRAGISGFQEAIPRIPPEEPLIGAIVPARGNLKKSPWSWLVNLAVRAIRECINDKTIDVSNTALLIVLPAPHRHHPALNLNKPNDLLLAIEDVLQQRFHPKSVVVLGGAAESLRCLLLARELLQSNTVSHCIVGGADSLLNAADINRLEKSGRLYDGNKNPQGLIPGEGAAFMLLSQSFIHDTEQPIARIMGVGYSEENATALGETFSTGIGMRKALLNAVKDAHIEESQIDLRVSDMNGERYHAWESLISTSRFYSTYRQHLCTWYPASSVGHIGAAAGILMIIAAAIGIFRGYAPGPIAMCEASSEEGLRAACLVAPAPNAPTPPFHSKAFTSL